MNTTAMQIAFAEAARREAAKYEEKKVEEQVQMEEKKPMVRIVYDWLMDEGEPRTSAEIGRALPQLTSQQIATSAFQLCQRGLAKRVPNYQPGGLMGFQALERVGYVWGARNKAPGAVVKRKSKFGRAAGSSVSEPAKALSQVVTEAAAPKQMRAIPGGLTLNVAGYVLTIKEAREIFDQLKVLFGE